MGSTFDQCANLRCEIERARLDFIRTDLKVCLTLTSIAETSYDHANWEHAKRTLASAEKGYFTLLRFYSQAKYLTEEVEHELQPEFKQLRERLDGLIQRRDAFSRLDTAQPGGPPR